MINSAATTMTSGIKAQNEGKALVEDTDRHIKRHTGTASNVDSGSIRVHSYEETRTTHIRRHISTTENADSLQAYKYTYKDTYEDTYEDTYKDGRQCG